jgi:flagellin-like hook-associated protein FlgL
LSLNYLNNILNYENKEVSNNLEGISSGKILLADDPANYFLYENLESYIRSLEKEIRNSQDMIYYYKTEDAILQNVSDIIKRINELIMKRSDGILSDFEKDIIDSEIKQLYDQIFDVFKQSEFNKIKIFSRIFKEKVIISVFNQKDIYNQKNIDNLLNFIIRFQAEIGSKINTIEFSLKSDAALKENTSEMQSYGDTKVTGEISNLKRNQILLIANILMIKQIKN